MENNTRIAMAYHKIKQMILNQKLIAGQKLIYDDLAKILGMSRTPIINALFQLEHEGYLVSESFRGFSVKPIDIQEAWNLFGVREALELYSVQKAIENSKLKDLRELKEKIKKHEEFKPKQYNIKRFIFDAEIHLEISRLTKNKVLQKQLKANLEHVYLRFALTNYNTDRMKPSVKEHYELLKSIENKDIIGGVELMRKHIQLARDNVIKCLTIENEEISIIDNLLD